MKKRTFVSLISAATSFAIMFTSLAFTNIFSVSAVDYIVNENRADVTRESATDYANGDITDLPTVSDEPAQNYVNGYTVPETLDLYSAAEAAEAGVPEGYGDNVLKLYGTSNGVGVVLDFTSWGIKVEDIASMTLRYHVDSSCGSIRMANNGAFIVNDGSIAKGQWAELTLKGIFDKFNNNQDGTLGKVALCFRYGTTFYVDSIAFTLKDKVDNEKDYFKNPVGRDEIPYDIDRKPSLYSYDDMAIYTVEEAKAAGVPEGYTGHVMMLHGTTSAGIAMDLTDWQIPYALVKSMTFRVYVPEGVTEVRLADKASNFIVRHAPAQVNTWIDVTLYRDGQGFYSSNFTAMLNDDQTIGAFDLCLRYANGASVTTYIDGFTFDLKENDGAAPVIQYNGGDSIETSAGKPFVLQNLIAYDACEERYVQPILTWTDGAFDENGLLNKGTHTCVAVFSDYHGNTSEITLQIKVNDKDTEAPAIKFNFSTIYATAGTRVDLAETIVAVDNYDSVTPFLTWSEGALDAHDRLQVGTHTLTITATDLTGLQSQKTITFIVSDDADAPATPTPVK